MMIPLKLILSSLLVIVLAGCASSSDSGVAATKAEVDNSAAATVLFVADAQIHNVYGGDVKQTMGIADFFSGVARRHPETNLLARYALQDSIERGIKASGPLAAPFVVMLGDATNVACTGEYERFTAAVNKARGNRVLLMAHGNHDSYLMGTINYWQSTSDQRDLTPFANAVLPVDASWFGPVTPPTEANSSGWKPLCNQNIVTKGAPMHKVQWMAKYLDSLRSPDGGLELVPGAVNDRVISFSGHGKAGSPLAALNYVVKGEWIRPDNSSNGLRKTYDSFLVQAVDVGTAHRLIIVDTSACAMLGRPWYKRPVNFWAQNFGLYGCMRESQFKLIDSLIGESRNSGRQLVFAGHFPLKAIVPRDKDEFVELMKRASGKNWTYLSAHTHDPMTVTPYAGGAKEINIGSTTDWPMAAYRIWFGASISSAPVPSAQPMQDYAPPAQFPTGPELCRHIDAAEALALDTDRLQKVYRSPGTAASYQKCIDEIGANWLAYEQRLIDAEAEIERRMVDPVFKARMLSIMAGSSLHESRQITAKKLLPWHVR